MGGFPAKAHIVMNQDLGGFQGLMGEFPAKKHKTRIKSRKDLLFKSLISSFVPFLSSCPGGGIFSLTFNFKLLTYPPPFVGVPANNLLFFMYPSTLF
jgi:hypothetical protein